MTWDVTTAWVGSGPTEGGQDGIWLLSLGGKAGLEPTLSPVIEAEAPTFLTTHPTLPRLYAISEVEAGAVTSFEVRPGAKLRRIAEVSSGGVQPCHIAVHPEGRWLYVSHYGDGSLAAIGLSVAGEPTGERIMLEHSGSGPIRARQEGSHAHSAIVSPCGRYLVVADLGTDELRAYALDKGEPAATAIVTAMPPGFGPRSMEILGDHLYVTGELGGEVAVVYFDHSGVGQIIQRVRVVRDVSKTPVHLSHVMAAPGGLLVGVRGPDSISTLLFRSDGVQLDIASEVRTADSPRHMALVGGAVVVAGQSADMVAVHSMGTDGTAGGVAAQLPLSAPMCILPTRTL